MNPESPECEPDPVTAPAEATVESIAPVARRHPSEKEVWQAVRELTNFFFTLITRVILVATVFVAAKFLKSESVDALAEFSELFLFAWIIYSVFTFLYGSAKPYFGSQTVAYKVMAFCAWTFVVFSILLTSSLIQQFTKRLSLSVQSQAPFSSVKPGKPENCPTAMPRRQQNSPAH